MGGGNVYIKSYEDNIHLSKYENVVLIPKIFTKFIQSREPFQILYGSRFSAKSHFTATRLLLKCLTQPYFRCVFARDTQKGVKESLFQLFLDKIKAYPILHNKFEVYRSELKIVCKNGNYLVGGSFEKAEKLKSFADLTDFWAEEPINREFSMKRNDFLDIAGTLRSPYPDIVPTFHFTFNPISKNTWIYKDFFEKQIFDTEILKVNYTDNPFCPKKSIDFLEQLKILDPKRYLIEGLGEWGQEQSEDPYFYNFTHKQITFNNKIDPTQAIYLSFDFNKKNSLLFAQIFSEKRTINVFDSLQQGGTGMDLEAIVKEVCLRFPNQFIFITGDASGNSASAYTSNNASAYTLINEYLEKYGRSEFSYSFRVPKANPHTDESKTVCNYIMKIATIEIDSSNEILIDDLLRMRQSNDGKLDKLHADKHGYGHLGDAYRYLLFNFCRDWMTNFIN